MKKTYIIGHRNPDTDSVCAPYCYTWLKRQLQPEGNFIPGVLGNLNPQTSFIFEYLGIEPPALVRDVCPTALDIMKPEVHTVNVNDPVGLATRLMDEHKVRNVPVVDEANNYLGLITFQEIAHYFMPRQYDTRPLYPLRPDNFGQVIPGYYLRRGGQEEVELRMMVGAMAYETFIQRLEQSLAVNPALPLLIVGNRPDIIDFALRRHFPVIILTGMGSQDCSELDLSGFQGWIFVSEVDTAETIRLLRISIPTKAIANRDLPVLAPDARLDEIKSTFMKLSHHGIAVLQDRKLLGLVTSSCLIDPPRHKVIMVDHNEPAHSVEGLEQAEIIEIIDHHRLDTIRSRTPIYVYADPLGSSCTLVWKLIRGRGLTPPPEIAALLLSGLLSDTIILRSPTTTAEDRVAAEELASLAGLEVQAWGTEIFAHAASLSVTDPDEAVGRDFKVYTESGYRVGIAQIEVITLRDFEETKDAFLEALGKVKEKFSLDWAMLLVTDIIAGESMLLGTPFRLSSRLIYHRLDEHSFLLPDVLSRKKQLLPEVIYALKEH
jgi:manganese-dependent inorganic pyrophosphatase